MTLVNLQVPMDKKVKDSATKVAKKHGFSSLQEAMRVFAKQLSDEVIRISFESEEVIKLSPRAEARYTKMEEDFEKGKNVYYAEDVEDLMSQLHGNSLPKKVSEKLQKKNTSQKKIRSSIPTTP